MTFLTRSRYGNLMRSRISQRSHGRIAALVHRCNQDTGLFNANYYRREIYLELVFYTVVEKFLGQIVTSLPRYTCCIYTLYRVLWSTIRLPRVRCDLCCRRYSRFALEINIIPPLYCREVVSALTLLYVVSHIQILSIDE